MKVSNFTTEELTSYLEKGETNFFNYRKQWELCYSRNCGFYFMEVISGRLLTPSLPHTKRGRFVAFTDKQTKNYLK